MFEEEGVGGSAGNSNDRVLSDPIDTPGSLDPDSLGDPSVLAALAARWCDNDDPPDPVDPDDPPGWALPADPWPDGWLTQFPNLPPDQTPVLDPGWDPALVAASFRPRDVPPEPVALTLANWRPSGWLALDLDATTARPGSMSDALLIDALVGWDHLISWATARQARVLAEFGRRRPDDPQAVMTSRVCVGSDRAPDEVALALRLSRGAAGNRLGRAAGFTDTLTDTLQLLEQGRLDRARAHAICDTVAFHTPDLALAVQARVLPKAPGQTLAQLRAALWRAVIAVDPRGAAERHRAARKERRVTLSGKDDGMASLWALLAAPDAIASYEWLTRLARSLGKDDPRPMHARRADLLVDLLTGRLELHDTDSSDADSDDTGPEDTASDDTASDDTASDDTASDDTGPEDTGPDDTGSKEIADRSRSTSRCPSSANPQSAGAESADRDGTEETGTEETGTTVPDDTEPDDSEPDDTEPDDTEPDDSEPDDTEPDDSEPDDSEPDDSEPDDSEPDDSEPDDSEPDDSELDDSELDDSEPDDSEPDDSEPDDSEPDDSELDDSEPDDSEPDDSEPDEPGDPLADGTGHDRRKRKKKLRRGCGKRPARAGKPLVHVIVPYSTLTGADDQPCELVGYGPIPADLARTIAADAVWKRLITDPLSGVVLDHARDTYRPPTALAEFVRARDLYCRMPGCPRQASNCELDHTIDWAKGGTTTDTNLYTGCLHDHRVKDRPGWSVRQTPDGRVEWTTPTGHRYHTDPHDYRPDNDPEPPLLRLPPARDPVPEHLPGTDERTPPADTIQNPDTGPDQRSGSGTSPGAGTVPRFGTGSPTGAGSSSARDNGTDRPTGAGPRSSTGPSQGSRPGQGSRKRGRPTRRFGKASTFGPPGATPLLPSDEDPPPF